MSSTLRQWRPIISQPIQYVPRRCRSTVSALTKGARAGYRDPYRILFFGADSFSVTSLKALINAQSKGEIDIETLHVACRTPKMGGKKNQEMRIVPIDSFARSRDVPRRLLDNFTWYERTGFLGPLSTTTGPRPRELNRTTPKDMYNLIIAVSFGLLIPAKLIKSMKYGGINLHPSLLPDLRGAAPIAHAIKYGYETTGVTVQTLHPTKFDHGQIIDQREVPIPNPDTITTPGLTSKLAPEGAKLLLDVLQKHNFAKGEWQSSVAIVSTGEELRKAPKVNKEFRRAQPKTMTSTDILRCQRAFGVMYSNLWDQDDQKHTALQWAPTLQRYTGKELAAKGKPGSMYLEYPDKSHEPSVVFYCADGKPLKCAAPLAVAYAGTGGVRKLVGLLKKKTGIPADGDISVLGGDLNIADYDKVRESYNSGRDDKLRETIDGDDLENSLADPKNGQVGDRDEVEVK